MRLLTLGHGTASGDDLAAVIREAGIERVADIRTVPKSKRHSHFVWGEMERWIPGLTGARYEWHKDLGGFRKPRPDSANLALRHPAFRGYADYMETPQFQDALDDLLKDAGDARTVLLCSESLWWRCHRRLVADAAVLLHGIQVQHLFHTGKIAEHVPTAGVRVLDGKLRYDLATTEQE